MDEKNNDNFWSWLGRQPLSAKVAEDIVVFREEDHPREKGNGKGGRFATKPETIEEQDFLQVFSKNSKSYFRSLRDYWGIRVPKDGTYDLRTMKPIVGRKDGFQVSFQEDTTEDPSHGSFIPGYQYDEMVEKMMKETGSDPELGCWGGKAEISFKEKSFDKAMAMCRRFNQEGVWDWKNDTFVPNEDFVGREHYTDRDNHATKNYHKHKPLTKATSTGQSQGTNVANVKQTP